ncbi:MAG TPA: DUF3102 domain-containing protein [Leptospiraceae bacterium]|nr:DUF3102 domain-containing protein [Leptospiraceae bacterium]HNI25528.1 DUF3102 domain-containing protein [Leptospiraceae bacterium]HNO26292.1 DUF3102 domain-containing protein [Leptospiraceae bacterium]
MTELDLEQIKAMQSRTDRIELLHKSILIMRTRSFEFGVMIGEELTKQRDELPYGTFIKWMKDNLPLISRSTANRYIRVYENQDELREKLGEHLELKKAYSLLSKRTEKTVNSKSKQNVHRQHLDDKLRQSIREHKKKVSKAKRKALSGKPLLKTEQKLLLSDLEEQKEKSKSRIEKKKMEIEREMQKILKYEEIEKRAKG